MKPEATPVSSRSAPPPRWITWCAAGAIVLAGLAAYSNSFRGAFVFDDRAFLDQPAARSLWPVWSTVTGLRPVVQFSLALNYALGGPGERGYHALNLAIHLLAALTLFGIVRRTLLLPSLAPRFGRASTALAFCIGLLWALHPLQTEAVTYIIQRMESLMGLFYLLTLYCFIRAAEDERPIRGARVWQAAAALACAMGMGCKEVMATAPAVVLLYDRTFVVGSFREALRRRGGFYLALAATWGILAGRIAQAFSRHAESAGFHLPNLTPAAYARSELGVVLHYLRLAFWPSGLCLDYNWPVAKRAAEILPGAAVVGGLLAATVWALARRKACRPGVRPAAWRELGFIGAWFFLTLAPTSSFMPVKDLAFEHRMYLALAGVIAAAVFAAYQAGKRVTERLQRARGAGRRREWAQIAAPAALMLAAAGALGLLTFRRNEAYRSGISIWEDTLRGSPGNVRAWCSLGWEWRRVHEYDKALLCLDRAIELDPNYSMAYNNRAAVYSDTHRYAAAVRDYGKAIALKGDFAPAYNDRAAAYILLGRYGRAVRDCDMAIRLNRNYAVAYGNRAAAFFQLGEYPRALSDCGRALGLKSDYAEAHWIRGNVFLATHRLAEAVEEYGKAIEGKPDYAEAYINRAVARYQMGDYEEARADVKKSEQSGGRPAPEFLQALEQAPARPE